MSDKQLGLDQLRLHEVADVEDVSGVEEASYLLETGSSMAAGTDQQQISETEQPLVSDANRYLGETGSDYEDTVQEKLGSGSPTQTGQAELGDYERKRVASD